MIMGSQPGQCFIMGSPQEMHLCFIKSESEAPTANPYDSERNGQNGVCRRCQCQATGINLDDEFSFAYSQYIKLYMYNELA